MTNPVGEGPSAGEAQRGALAEIVYRVNNPLYGDYCHHWETADAVLAAGYRLVSDDPDTVERVARAIYSAKIQQWKVAEGIDFEDQWDEILPDLVRDQFRELARAALAALRGGE